MIDTLRDQLLNLGFKAPEPVRKPPQGRPGQGGEGRQAQGGKGRKDAAQAGRQARGEGRPRPQGQARPGGRNEGAGRPGGATPARRKPASEMDLGKAWALRANHEKQERIDAERARQEEARLRREAKAALEQLLQGKALNEANAEIARHFEYGGKIKRIYVNEAQLKALNAGELGVVQLNGRYLLVEAGVLAQAEGIFPQAVALKGPSQAPAVEAAAPGGDDPYADPRYQVPDDLVW